MTVADLRREPKNMITLTVKGMKCQGCVRSVKGALEALDTGAAIEVDLESGKVEIGADSGRDAYAAAIADAGFEVVN